MTQLLSHAEEPQVGTYVVNTNPKCPHYQSAGKVLSVDSLPEDSGRTVTYLVMNPGETFQPGDTLTKTLDQLKVVKK